MIVSGGHILAIDGVNHDLTLSGDGVRTPIGITEELLEKIRDVSGKLDTTAFETWSAQTEHWDVQEYSGGEGIKVENHLISVSAKYLTSGDLQPYATKAWVEAQDYLTSGDLEPYAKTQWVQEELDEKQDASAMSAYATSAWVDENFQPKGDYITPDDLKPYATSAWVNEELAKKVDVSAMSAYATSAWVDENFLREADYHEYSAGNDYIRIDEYKVYGYDWTSAVSAVPFKLDTSAFNQYSAWADETYLKQKDLEGYATSGGLEENQQYAMTNSGWAPVDIPDETVVSGTSGISAQKIGDTWIVGTSAKFATSGDIDPDKQYALTTSGWTEVEIPKDYPEVQAGPNINVDPVTYPDDPTLVSAYVLSGHKAAALTSSGGSLEITSSGEQSFNIDVKRVAPEYASYYNDGDTNVGTSFTKVTLHLGDHSQDWSGLEGLETGLYHVDATFAVQRTSNTVNRGMERIEFSNNGTTKLIDLGEFDASNTQINYVNISFDKFNPASLSCYMKAESVGWVVNVERYDVHRVFDMNLIGNIISELSDYSDGDGINIDEAYHTINVVPSSGIKIDADKKVAMNISSGIKFDQDQKAYIPLTSGIGYEADGSLKALITSGLAFDEDKYMYVPLSSGLAYDNNGICVKVGAGLKFDDDQGVVAITIDSQVEEVVETVESLKAELDNKLTTNMNVSDAKKTNNVAPPIPENGEDPSWGATFFTVPLQHNLNELTSISIITSDALQSAAYPLIIGILEYNFDFLDPNVPDSVAAGYPPYYSTYNSEIQGPYWRSRTTWIADTGVITASRVDVDGGIPLSAAGKHTYRLKNRVQPEVYTVTKDGQAYTNEVGPTLRSDRGYYLIILGRKAQGITRIMSDEGYDENTNSDPIITYGSLNPEWYETPTSTAQAMKNWSNETWQTHVENDDLSFSAISYWTRDVPEAKGLGRPYVMIRNSVR
jgi:hypothetical protein